MKKISYLIFLMLAFILLPNSINAGGSSDDIVYSATFEEGYTYGNVADCVTSSGIAWFEGIETISGYKVCLWNSKDKVGTDIFKCEDTEMERFTLGRVTDNNGKEYWGFGCRKANPEKIEYIKRSLKVGYGEQLAYQYSNTCTIIEGDAVQINKHNGCWIDAIKAGNAKVKVVNNDNQTVTYYEYEVTSPTISVTELDQNYYYGNIDKCQLNPSGGTVKLNGYIFCGSSAPGYNFESYEVSCIEEGFDTFKIIFTADNGITYKGYGCRKIKNEQNIEYIKKQIYVGEGVQLAYEHSHKCIIISGTAGKINEWNVCYFDALEPGIVKIKVVSESTGIATYYEYTIEKAITTAVELDQNYNYGKIKNCALAAGNYTVGTIYHLDGVELCAYGAPGYNYEKREVTCKNSNYTLFQIAFSLDGNTLYKGYGCRRLKTEDNPDVNIEIEPIEKCEALLGLPTEKGSPAWYLSFIFKVLRYIAIIILIVLTIMDFVGAVASHDNDILKKVGNKAIKRMILCVIIFLLPTLIEFILQIIGENQIDLCIETSKNS